MYRGTSHHFACRGHQISLHVCRHPHVFSFDFCLFRRTRVGCRETFWACVTFSACLGVAVGALFTRSAACSASSASLHFCSYSRLDYGAEKKRGELYWEMNSGVPRNTNTYTVSRMLCRQCERNCDVSVVAPVRTAHPLPPPLICTFSTSHFCAARTTLPAHALTTLDTRFPLPLPARTVSLVQWNILKHTHILTLRIKCRIVHIQY